jgi:hypothetical protein
VQDQAGRGGHAGARALLGAIHLQIEYGDDVSTRNLPCFPLVLFVSVCFCCVFELSIGSFFLISLAFFLVFVKLSVVFG